MTNNEKKIKAFSSTNQPSPEARQRAMEKRRLNRKLEEKLLMELFKEDIPCVDEKGKKSLTSGIAYGIRRMKHIMCTTKNEKLAMDIFFKFLERMFGKPQVHIEANVESENFNYSREDIIKMILTAKEDKIINLSQDDVK